jgi:hypothetical protein
MINVSMQSVGYLRLFLDKKFQKEIMLRMSLDWPQA